MVSETKLCPLLRQVPALLLVIFLPGGTESTLSVAESAAEAPGTAQSLQILKKLPMWSFC
jgi:hypothetical protein